MKLKNPFKELTRFELCLWLCSVAVVAVSFLISSQNWMTLIASLIGVTALIFVAKGFVFGLVLSVVFAVFYGIISCWFRYYGEMITYLFMSAPIALLSIFSWLKNPYKDTAEVKVSRMSRGQVAFMCALTAVVTAVFYFLLKALGTANLAFSTVSVTTSFLACYLSMMRSPYYALGYAANDIVLIVLWILAAMEDLTYLPMIFCFVMFLINDAYGFWNWRRMQKRQAEA